MQRIIRPGRRWLRKLKAWLKPSLKGKVRWAFVYVIAIITPMVTLSLYYATELTDRSSALEKENQKVDAIVRFQDKVMGNLDYGRPLLHGTSLHKAELEAMRLEVGGMLASLRRLGLEQQRELACLGSQGERSDSIAGALLHSLLPCRSSAWRDAVRDNLRQLRGSAEGRTTALRLELIALADSMTRNLVTLFVLCSLICLYLLMRFPERLLVPLNRVTHSIKMARGGKANVRAPLTNIRELDELSVAFNEAMISVDSFDAMKRERIALDSRRLEALLGMLDEPAGLITLDGCLEAANEGLVEFLALGKGWRGRPLAEMLPPGMEELQPVLARLYKLRSPVSVKGRVGGESLTSSCLAEIVPVVGLEGDTGGAVLVLKEIRHTA